MTSARSAIRRGTLSRPQPPPRSRSRRQGEALWLRWEYVDLATGDVRVWWRLQRNRWRHGCDDPHACGERLHRPTCPKDCRRHATACPQRYGGGLAFRRPKGKSRRTVTLPARLVDALREHKAAQDLEQERADSNETPRAPLVRQGTTPCQGTTG